MFYSGGQFSKCFMVEISLFMGFIEELTENDQMNKF